MKSPRILLVVPDVAAPTGGIAMVSRSIMRLLAAKQRDDEVDYQVVSLRDPADEAERRQLLDCCGWRMQCHGGRLGAFSRAVLWRMARWADLAIFTHVGPASLLPLVPRWLRPASIILIHGIEVWVPLSARKRRGLSRADAIVSNTEFTARKARCVNPWLPPTRVCHLGIPAVALPGPTDPTVKLNFTPRAHDIVIVGRMAKGEGQKGHQELIAAMPDVAAAVPDARLIVVGSGDDSARYEMQAQRSPVAASIHFTGYLREAELWQLYLGCGVLAMPSRQEGFGLTYLEAMRAGLPCIASDCDAAQEVIEDGETGLLVSPDDRAALAAALVRVLSDEPLRRRLGAKGKARFEQHFTESRFQDGIWQVAQELLSRAGKTACNTY